MGAVLRGHLPVLLAEQGAPGAALGAAQGEPQDHDLPEDGACAEELLAHRGDLQGEEEAHVPVRRGDAEGPAGKRGVGGGGEEGGDGGRNFLSIARYPPVPRQLSSEPGGLCLSNTKDPAGLRPHLEAFPGCDELSSWGPAWRTSWVREQNTMAREL